MDFTVVLEESAMEAPSEQLEEEVAPEPLPEPPDPVPLPVTPKESVTIKKPQPPKPKPKPKPPPPPQPPKPKPKPKPFVKGRRVAPVKPREDFTKLKPVTSIPAASKPLTRAEIQKALHDGARPGARNVLPDNEISRCVVLIRSAMYEAWNQPGAAESGPRPTLLEIRLNNAGRLVSYKIAQSSGSAYFDQTVLKAAATVAPIRGLSAEFLKQFETLVVEFKLEN